MRRAVYSVTMVFAGLLLGLGSAWYAIAGGAVTGVAHGPWENNPLVGSATAGPWDRARVAHHALLGLTREEAVYYVATRDSDGRPLSADATYRISGAAIPARWWSITAYGPDYYLIPNAQGVYSFNSETVSRREDGGFAFLVSRAPREGDWLPLGEAKRFDLLLRLYNPRGGASASDLPVIERVDGDE
ncbi:MAG TPA: DUF1214 domain-containing protein [Woeseiaceae bacterium]|nr:DUF1214 domain-containing protein [Woeseiaceae bacterium]